MGLNLKIQKNSKKKKKTRNWHVALTLTPSGQSYRWGPNWVIFKKMRTNRDNEKLKDQTEISWQIKGSKGWLNQKIIIK